MSAKRPSWETILRNNRRKEAIQSYASEAVSWATCAVGEVTGARKLMPPDPHYRHVDLLHHLASEVLSNETVDDCGLGDLGLQFVGAVSSGDAKRADEVLGEVKKTWRRLDREVREEIKGRIKKAAAAHA